MTLQELLSNTKYLPDGEYFQKSSDGIMFFNSKNKYLVALDEVSLFERILNNFRKRKKIPVTVTIIESEQIEEKSPCPTCGSTDWEEL